MKGRDFDPAAFRKGPARRVLLLGVVGRFPFKEYVQRASPTLGIPYLAAAARAAGHEVSVLTAGSEGAPALRARLSEFAPDLVGMSCYQSNFDVCMQFAALVKALRPGTHVVLGGPQASASPDLCLACPHVDSVAVGEGELTLCALLQALPGAAGLAGVDGLLYRDGQGRIRRNRPRALIGNLDSLPPPALDLYDRDAWQASFEGRSMAPVLGSRGCPFPCTFCASKVVWGPTCRWHSPARIIAEMDALHAAYGIEHFNFYDGTFSLDRRRVGWLCRRLRGRRYTWTCSTRTDRVDAPLLKTMKDAGCKAVLYGLESASQRLLDRVRKGGETVAGFRRVVAMTRAAGLLVGGVFLIGLPTETDEETRATITLMSELQLDTPGLNIAIPFMGTEMHADALRHGRLRKGATPDDLARSEAWEPEGRTREDLRRWLQEGMDGVKVYNGSRKRDGKGS